MQERRFLLITSFLVALIGAPAVYSVVQEPLQITKIQHQISLQVQASVDQLSSAGLVSGADQRKNIKSKSVVLDYSCKGDKMPYQVDGTLVRFKGTACIDENWTDVAIVNHTNGFTGSVIFLKDKNFTTDFIDLQEGENKLEVQAKDENGKTVQQLFRVNRRFPASASNSEN